MSRAKAMLLYLMALAAVAGGVWWFALTSDLRALSERGQADLSLASDRMVGQLQRFRELAVLLSDHPELTALLDGRGNAASASGVLQRTADRTGSSEILAVSASGRVLASSKARSGTLGASTYLRRALSDGALGTYHAVDPETGERAVTFAAPVFAPSGPVAGAVIVRANVSAVEAEWRGDAMTVAFTDSYGVVFSSNRSELLFGLRGEPSPEVAERYRGIDLVRFPDVRELHIAGLELWSLDAGRYLPRIALHLTRPLPVIGMTGEALVDVAPSLQLASWQALVVLALGLMVGALVMILADRRRTLAERLELEAGANAVLERRVRERTAELSATNAALRRQVEERKAAEAALKRAQADLVQAGKLSALGQMSAGISHELNQPLMAISSFAENSTAFLERGRPEKAAENLGKISELARRMGRIIRNLRAFARQEVGEVRAVDLVAVVEAVLELGGGRLRRDEVVLDWERPKLPVLAMGGEVRLQQVVMNLVSNAVDAMEGRPEKRLTIRVEPGNPVRLRVADTGCGIDAPDRIFDPFYSTKEVGHSEGMGLGLSISYGIVQSFGGVIRGSNRPGGGAEFVVELSPFRDEVAA
ncbi:sensor histidine kinase [Tropicimonas sediminicola]|uniref:C4-dicarboxylate transport sensor protein DctB n=1 Tax=Tropicimonas sediminicola TaxID=1031541 RepID=A0A239DBX7_9RHOB|nr:ATP-binding protein [Tropicimonas sediminicola]SNS29829.1 two-component system, NtrC family, C4-dicarboxylate transport sensor histidine kinase DctB [Tropicimonas sediminicola]